MSNLVSTGVLYLQIYQPVCPLLLEISCLPFSCFSSICWMGRTDEVAWSGSSNNQFICVQMWIIMRYDKSWCLELLTVLLSWLRLMGLYPGNRLRDCVLPQSLCKKVLCKKEEWIFWSPFPGTDFNPSSFQNWECNKKKLLERCSL